MKEERQPLKSHELMSSQIHGRWLKQFAAELWSPQKESSQSLVPEEKTHIKLQP